MRDTPSLIILISAIDLLAWNITLLDSIEVYLEPRKISAMEFFHGNS